MSQFNIWTNWILNPSRPRCSVSEPYMRMKTVTQSFPPNIFWGEAARLVWTWWASELVCVTWVADTSSCWSILIWVAPPGVYEINEQQDQPQPAGAAAQNPEIQTLDEIPKLSTHHLGSLIHWRQAPTTIRSWQLQLKLYQGNIRYTYISSIIYFYQFSVSIQW